MTISKDSPRNPGIDLTVGGTPLGARAASRRSDLKRVGPHRKRAPAGLLDKGTV